MTISLAIIHCQLKSSFQYQLVDSFAVGDGGAVAVVAHDLHLLSGNGFEDFAWYIAQQHVCFAFDRFYGFVFHCYAI